MTGKHLSEDQIQRMIASDPNAPEATDEQLAQAKPFAEVSPTFAEAMRKNVGGRPKAENPKVAVSLRLDRDVVARFKASGPSMDQEGRKRHCQVLTTTPEREQEDEPNGRKRTPR